MKEPVFVTPLHSDLGIDHREELAVIGGGHMGADIAREFDRSCNYRTIHIVDVEQRQLDRAKERLTGDYYKAALKRLGNAFMAEMQAGNVVRNRYNFILAKPEDRKYDSLENVSLIVEAASEGAKKAVYDSLSKSKLKQDVVIATNTSAVPLPEIEEHVGSQLEENIVSAHFYTPAGTNPLIDVTANKGSKSALKQMSHIADKMSKKTITHNPNYSFAGSVFFEYAAAVAVEAVQNGERVEDVDRRFEALGFREGPLKSLDRTQHFAFIGCGKVLGRTLPEDSATKRMFEGETHIKDFMKALSESKNTGLESEAGKGIYQWDKPGDMSATPIKAFRPEQRDYTDVVPIPDKTIDSIEREDEESGYYRTISGIAKLLDSDTETGRKARRDGLQIIREQIDQVNRGVLTPGQAFATVREGLRSKLTLEVYDFMGKEKFLELIERAKKENPNKAEFLSVDETKLPEKFLEYGRLFNTPVSPYNNEKVDAEMHEGWEIKRYTELVVEKNVKDGVAVVTMHNPSKRNPITMAFIDQMDYAMTDIENDERIKSLVLAPSGEDMLGAGADVYAFIHGKFERGKKTKLSVEKALALSEKGRELFDRIKDSKKFTVMAMGNVFGGVAELSYNFDSIVMKNNSRIIQPEFAGLGIGDGLSGYANLKDRVGEDAAMSVFLGESLKEEDAFALGLADDVGSGRLGTIGKAYEMAKRAAVGEDVKEKLAQERISRDRSSVRLKSVSAKPGDSITEKAKELNMSPQALERLLEKREHYHERSGVDHKFESDSIRTTFTEPNAQEGLTALLEGRRPRYDYSTAILSV